VVVESVAEVVVSSWLVEVRGVPAVLVEAWALAVPSLLSLPRAVARIRSISTSVCMPLHAVLRASPNWFHARWRSHTPCVQVFASQSR
jgi:hypothetical protein